MSLEFRFRPPSSSDSPILFMVHGRGGDKNVMWTFNRAAPEGWGLYAPQAPLSDSIGGFSWWLIDAHNKSEQIENAALLLRNFIAEHSGGARALVAAGFSQGAGLLSLLMQREPSLFKGVALLAGFVLKEPKVESAQRSRVFMGHGTLDETISIETALAGAERLKAAGFELEFHQDPVGHKIGSASMRALKDFLDSLSAT